MYLDIQIYHMSMIVVAGWCETPADPECSRDSAKGSTNNRGHYVKTDKGVVENPKQKHISWSYREVKRSYEEGIGESGMTRGTGAVKSFKQDNSSGNVKDTVRDPNLKHSNERYLKAGSDTSQSDSSGRSTDSVRDHNHKQRKREIWSPADLPVKMLVVAEAQILWEISITDTVMRKTWAPAEIAVKMRIVEEAEELWEILITNAVTRKTQAPIEIQVKTMVVAEAITNIGTIKTWSPTEIQVKTKVVAESQTLWDISITNRVTRKK